MMKQGKGYLTVKNFIKDFEPTNANYYQNCAESNVTNNSKRTQISILQD